MLRVCLGILKNLPQYAYKLYAYKKHLFYQVSNKKVSFFESLPIKIYIRYESYGFEILKINA